MIHVTPRKLSPEEQAEWDRRQKEWDETIGRHLPPRPKYDEVPDGRGGFWLISERDRKENPELVQRIERSAKRPQLKDPQAQLRLEETTESIRRTAGEQAAESFYALAIAAETGGREAVAAKMQEMFPQPGVGSPSPRK